MIVIQQPPQLLYAQESTVQLLKLRRHSMVNANDKQLSTMS